MTDTRPTLADALEQAANAPSFSHRLDEAAHELQKALDFARKHSKAVVDSAWDAACPSPSVELVGESTSELVALLTRAAALARAAEKAITDCPRCFGTGKEELRSMVVAGEILRRPCSTCAGLRALIAAEGPSVPVVDEIPAGSRWRDNDKRMNGRVVVVERVDAEFVWYRFVVLNRSRRERFLKAFTRAEG